MLHTFTLSTAILLLFGGISTAQGDDKTMPTDLGKIQPPGGGPLPIGERGKEISVDYLQKATKRLDSAPLKELDKWVAEIERITDKKLEGDLAKQGCRTSFATHMSLAFDDLTWNPKA